MRTIACTAGYGKGGLGQTFTRLIEDARREGTLAGYLGSQIKPGDEGLAKVVVEPISPFLINYTPVRMLNGFRNHAYGDLFDRTVARMLDTCADTYVGFGGQALHSFRRARKLGAGTLELHAANSHVDNVMRQHEKALRRWPIEQSWLNDMQRRKTIVEYAAADVIVAASQYTWDSLVSAGIPDYKLRMLPRIVNPRFVPPVTRPSDGVFRVVYIGSVTVTKGVPVLIEAFSHLTGEAELTLIGGITSRGMKRYIKDWTARDPRIRVAPGDPLEPLQRADVCVHPTFEDGYGYAPAEALACGVMTIVTEDTGMKNLIKDGVNGYIVPTGSWEAILERMEFVRDRRLVARGSA